MQNERKYQSAKTIGNIIQRISLQKIIALLRAKLKLRLFGYTCCTTTQQIQPSAVWA